MTVKDIAQAVNKTERGVRNWVVKAGEKFSSIKEKISLSSPMNPADYSLDEVHEIIKIGLGQNAADVFRMAASTTKMIHSDPYDHKFDRLLEAITTMSQVMSQMIVNQTQVNVRVQNTLPAININPRDQIREILSRFSQKTGVPYKDTWNEFYQKCYFHLHINAPLKAKNIGGNIKPLDILENEGLINEALSIVKRFFS